MYPLKDKVDVWRVLIKGFEGSLYEKKWFYLIIEFTPEYPAHYPFFRFVYPPFHPNITDQGRICLDSIDQNYRSDKSIRELIGQIRYLLLNENFDSCVDLKREKFKNNQQAFINEVNKWNNQNGKDTPEEWEKTWKIQEDNESVKSAINKIHSVIVPEQFLCPITRTIMKEPVKASSGVHYEKIALEKYLNSTKNPVCKAQTDENGKPVPLPHDLNMNLKVDNELKTKINNWIKEKQYHEDEEEGNEDDNISDFKKKGQVIDKPDYLPKILIQKDDANYKNWRQSKIRPVLSE